MSETKSYLIEKRFDPNEKPEYRATLPELPGYEEEPLSSERGLFVVVASATEEVAQRIEAEAREGVRPHIVAVEPNHAASIPEPEVRTEAAQYIEANGVRIMIGADKAHEKGYKGKGRRIAVIDTGYSDATAKELGSRIVAAESYVSGEAAKNSQDTHGDWCLQMIAFLCPEAELVVLKGLSAADGTGYYSGIISCVRRARELGCTDANLSLGGPASQIMDDAVNAADVAGLIVSVAAGNEQGGKAATDYVADRSSPARAAGVLTSGAGQSDFAIAAFSNRGTCLDLAAPGVYVKAPNVDNYYSGTSMAAPGVCASGALAGTSGKSKSEVKQALLATARDTAEPPSAEGMGFVNVAAALSKLIPPASPPGAYQPGVPRISLDAFERSWEKYLDRDRVLTARRTYGSPVEEIGRIIPKGVDK